MLMGLGGNIEMWEPLRTHLADRGVRTIAIDVPGAGESPAPVVPLPLAVHAMIVSAVVRRLGVAKVDVMGVSWGGLLAQQLSLTSPRRVRRLVLVSTNFGLGSMVGNYRTITELLTQNRYLSAKDMATAAAAFGGDPAVASPDHPHTAARLARPPTRRGYYWQLLSPLGWSSLPFLWLFSQPTLVICGDNDLAIPILNARVLAKLIPNGRLEILPGGHLVAFEHPAQVATSVVTFLRGRRRSTRRHDVRTASG